MNAHPPTCVRQTAHGACGRRAVVVYRLRGKRRPYAFCERHNGREVVRFAATHPEWEQQAVA